MCNFQSLTITKIVPRRDGILVFTKYDNWYSEYAFFVVKGGPVMGRAASGEWLELDAVEGAYIQSKAWQVLAEEPDSAFT